jgi:prolyl-tRNA synthetase
LGFTEIEKIPTVLDEIQDDMLKTAREQVKENTIDISDYNEFKSKIEKGGFFNAPWCGKLECEEKIKEETGADIRVIPFDSENTNEKCMYCQEQSV